MTQGRDGRKEMENKWKVEDSGEKQRMKETKKNVTDESLVSSRAVGLGGMCTLAFPFLSKPLPSAVLPGPPLSSSVLSVHLPALYLHLL